MDFAKDSGGISGLEMVVLAALLLVCAVVAWQLYLRFSGRGVSDVQGLRFTRRPHTPPE
ncbi:MAG TPA: hypothetical protein VM890_14520 [Longimicrobium sp.]|jgi:hypothetical protein|nr:hypothetical protein [Longimicrobium sp.]